MAASAEIPRDQLNLLLGKVAREKGLLTPEQLREALAEQARAVGEGHKQDRTLGTILVSKGFLSEEQVSQLLEEQRSRASKLDAVRRDDTLFGKILMQQGVAAEHINECLRLQAEAMESGGEVLRLGELLIRKGYASAEVVSLALAAQKKSILVCSGCRKRYNVVGFDPTRTYRCKSCPGTLAPLPSLSNVHVESSDIGAASDIGPAVNVPIPAEKPKTPPLGKYTIIREVGRGGMGVVYEALDTGLNRKVALKLMIPSQHADPKDVKQEEDRFIREAQLSANLAKHPHIVSVYEAGILEGRRYMAMEFVHGLQMHKWALKADLRAQITLLRDVALAAHHAHENGIIHRDLKPANVLVDAQNRPHVMDFGLAKAVEQNVSVSLTAAGMVMGTPAYMSPEQAQGKKGIDRRADIYSLGVMLYEILAGRPPFQGATAIEILMQTVKKPPPPPGSFVKKENHPAHDKSLENICLKALAKNPAERYPTAKAFGDDVSKWLSGEEVRIILPKTTRKAYAPAQKPKTWLYAGIAAAAAVVLVGVIVAAGTSGSPDRELARAEKAMQEGDYTGALTAFGEALAKDPGNARALAGRKAAEEKLEEEKRAAVNAARDELERKWKELEEARKAAESARQEEARSKTNPASTGPPERERLEAERKRAEAEEAVRRAEEAARQAEERLKRTAPQAADPVAPAELRPGLVGEYHDGVDFARLVSRKLDPRIAFDSQASPWGLEGQTGHFSVRWWGYLRVPRAGRYVFETRSDDGVRLTIGERTIINNWLPHAVAVDRGEASLAEGFHRLSLEYYQGVGSAIVSLAWTGDPAVPPALVGPQALFHKASEYRPLATATPGPGPKPPDPAPPPGPAPLPSPPPAPAESRAGVPEAAAVKEAEKTVQEMFKADFAKRGPAERKALAERLIGLAVDGGETPAVQYVLLREAADMAGKIGEVAVAMAAAEELGKRFAVPALGVRRDTLVALSRAIRDPIEALPLAEACVRVAEAAVAADDFDVARAAARQAEATARFAKDDSLLGLAQARLREIVDLERAFAPVKAAEKTLQDKPDDGTANLAVGKYLCLKGDWERGLPHVAKASDKALKAAAEKDLAGPSEPTAQFEAAEAWWDLGERSRDLSRTRYQGRALAWYQKGWSGLKKAEKDKARERFRAALGGRPAPPPLTQSVPRWTMKPADAKVAHVDERFVRTGRSSVRLGSARSSFGGAKTELLSEGTPATPGREYEVSAWVLTDGTRPDKSLLFVHALTDDNRYFNIEGPQLPADQPFWNPLKASFTCPDGAVRLVVGIRFEGSEGQVWVDDVSLKEAGAPGELLKNPSLERK